MGAITGRQGVGWEDCRELVQLQNDESWKTKLERRIRADRGRPLFLSRRTEEPKSF